MTVKSIMLFVILLFVVQTNHIHNKLKKKKERKLGLGDSIADVRGLIQQKESDNPLADLWDVNHMKVAPQKINMNMNMPLNRLKMHVSSDYIVKVVVHNDEDFNRLYHYFYKEDE